MRDLKTSAIILIAILVAGIASFLLAIPPGFLAPIWLPGAVTLTAVLLVGYRALPAIGLGICLLTLTYGFHVLEAGIWRAAGGSIGFAIAAMIQAAVARRLVRPKPDQSVALETGMELVRLIVLGAILASMVGSIFAAAWVTLGGFSAPGLDFWSGFARNWAGNAVAAAAITPVLLVLFETDRVSRRRKRNIALVFTILATISLTTFALTRLNGLELRQEHFEAEVAEDHIALQESLNAARRRLESLQGFFAASENVSPEEFSTFVDIAFEQLDSVSSVHWMVVDADENMSRHALLTPVEGVRSAPGRRLMITADRELATDYFFDDLPALIDATLTSGAFSASALNASGPAAWVGLAIPAFAGRQIPADMGGRRESLRSVAVGTFRVEAILGSALSSEAALYSYRIRGLDAQRRTLWEHGQLPDDFALTTRREFSVGGQLWQVDYIANESFLQGEQDWVSWAVIVVGFCFISVLNALAMLSTARTDLVQRLVDEKTAESRTLSNNLSLILEHAADAIISFDQDGRGVLINPAAGELFGYAPDELVGEVIHDLIHPVDMRGRPHTRDECAMVQEALRHSPNSGHDRFRRKDGSDFFAEYATETMRDDAGRLIGAVTVVRDITERIEAEADRERFIERLTRANEELERFAFVASHDLQEPLRLISNFTGLLANRYGDQLDDAGQTYIRHTLDATVRMQTLITDLLAYGRLNSDADATRTEVDMGRLVEETFKTLGPSVQAARERIHIGDLPVVRGHPARLGQLMQNLISNAVKFQPEGQDAEVWIDAEDTGDSWTLSVADNGIGIKRDYRDQIFQPFKRLHSPDAYPGSGMGLAICRKIVESHGGALTISDNEPHGSIFRFTLPKIAPKPMPAPGTEPPEAEQ